MLLKKLFLIFAVLLMTDLIAAKENQTVKLNSGYEIPTLGLGTWTLTGGLHRNSRKFKP